ncbi:hypothetical protein BH23VER1_BH23VER1_20100 [soil metagenome]
MTALILIVHSLAGGLPAQDSEGQSLIAPDLSVPLFDRDRVALGEEMEATLVSALNAVASNHATGTKSAAVTRAKALALSLSLSPRNRDALVASGQLKLGVLPTPRPHASSTDAIVTTLRTAAEQLKIRSEEGSPRDSLSSLLLDTGATFDPSMASAIRTAPDWKRAVPADPSAGAGGGEAASLTMVPGPSSALPPTSLTTVLRHGGQAGDSPGACTVAARADSRGTRYSLTPSPIRFPHPVPDLLADLSNNIPSFLAPLAPGYEFMVELPEGLGGSEAGVAAAASALLVQAVNTSRPLDRPVMLIAALDMESGELQVPPDFHDRLLAAREAGAGPVVVPASAWHPVADLLTLGRPELLLDIQLFMAPDLAAAHALGEGAPAADSAFERYAALQTRRVEGEISPADALQELRAIVASFPDHLSAQVLVARSEGRLPSRLSLQTSAQEIRRIAAPMFEVARGELPLAAFATADAKPFLTSATELARSLPIFAPSSRRCAEAAIDLAKTVGGLIGANNLQSGTARARAVSLLANQSSELLFADATMMP